MYHFHNPYTKPYLVFDTKLIKELDLPSFPSSNKTNAHNFLSNSNSNLLTSVELHTQTSDPIISLGIATPIMLIFAASSVFIQSRTLQMLKHESSVNNRLMATQAKIHMIYWPVCVLAYALTENVYPLSTFTTPYFCTILSFFVNFCTISIILYTFYACLLRYICLLHTKKVEYFGKIKTIGLVYWLFYTHSFIWTTLVMFTSFNLDRLPLINKCYGWQDQVYLLELHDTTNMLKRHFCAFTSKMVSYCIVSYLMRIRMLYYN